MPETEINAPIEQKDIQTRREPTIAKIKANINQQEQEQQENQEQTDNTSEEEERQLDAAVASLDPIAEIKKRKKEEEDLARKVAQQKKEGIHNAQTIIQVGTDAFKNVQDQAFNTAEKIRDTAGGVWGSIGRVAIPGSIWLPVAILLIFFFLLLPINGYTRMQWLWLALIGQAQITSGGSGGGGNGNSVERQYTGVSVL